MESEHPDPESQPPVKFLTDTGSTDVSATDSSLKEKDAQAIETPSTPGPYRHMLSFAIGYAVVSFFCGLGLGDSQVPLFPLAACVYSTVLLVALWSVFGPGNYLIRLFWAHVMGAIPAVAMTLGVCIRFISEWNMFSELWYAVSIGLISVVPISLAAQLPFWFFRSLFGWQLVYRDDLPERSFSLRDVFVLTFVFAVCFAIPQTTANLQSRMFESNAYSDGEKIIISEAILQTDGSYANVDRVLTDAEASNWRRQRRREIQMGSYTVYGAYSLSVFVLSLLSIPVVMFAFRNKEPASGCGFTGLYVFGIWSLIMVISAIAFGGAPPEAFLYLGVLLALCVSAVAVPLMVSRETGFQLTSPKRFAREQRLD